MAQGKTIERVSMLDAWSPETDAGRHAIHEQLERLLANVRFKNSKRCPSLLRYLVENTLDGRTEHLRERSLGIDVFGRPQDYDTNADPIVRATAGDIRKRIAQYYHEPGHENEIRIDLPSGSYVPEFRLPPAPEPEPVVKGAWLRRWWKALALARRNGGGWGRRFSFCGLRFSRSAGPPLGSGCGFVEYRLDLRWSGGQVARVRAARGPRGIQRGPDGARQGPIVAGSAHDP